MDLGVLTIFLYVLYSFVCLLLILIVLVQPGGEEDLGGAFGGGGGSMDSFLGARGDTMLKKITVVFATLFFLLSIIIGVIEVGGRERTKGGGQNKGEQTVPLPAKKGESKG